MLLLVLLLRLLQVLLIEEAGELLEAHTLASLSAATEHVILIGELHTAHIAACLNTGAVWRRLAVIPHLKLPAAYNKWLLCRRLL
jgi:hypothetical protein